MGIVTVVIGFTVRANRVPDPPADYLNLKTFVNFHPRAQAPAKSCYGQVRVEREVVVQKTRLWELHFVRAFLPITLASG
jgi:hypothetical protein